MKIRPADSTLITHRPKRRNRWAVRALTAGVVLSTLVSPPVKAEVLEYFVEVPEGQPIAFVLEFSPPHPGALEIEAEWQGTRQLSFRLEGPGEPVVRGRRFGPSPQRMRVMVDEAFAGAEHGWKLLIRALPARGQAEGTVRIVLPEPVHEPPPITPIQRAVPTPPVEMETWAQPVSAPAGASTHVTNLFDAVEQLRVWMVDPATGLRPDPCGWQSDLLRYLARTRDGVSADTMALEEPTSRYLLRLAGAIESVDDLRTSTDPIVTGPAPEDDVQRRAWIRIRQEQIHPLEAELDTLGEAIRRGYAPNLEAEEWPARFLGCLMACERYFEQLPRLGRDRAANQTLAIDQWEGFLAAGRALDALASATPGRSSARISLTPIPSRETGRP